MAPFLIESFEINEKAKIILEKTQRHKTIIRIQSPQNFSIMKTKRLLILPAIICMASLFSVDLAYAYHPVSPYAYCNGNPIKYVDPNGMDVYRYDDKTGEMILFQKTDDNFDQI